MSMDKLERFFLSRYLKSPKRNLLRFSFVFMTLGIVLSVGILSAGLNLFEGYERSLKEVLLGSFPHLTLQKSSSEYLSVTDTEELVEYLRKQPEIAKITPAVNYSVMAMGANKVRGASLNAYDFSGLYPFPYDKYITRGKSTVKDGEIIVGSYLASELGKKTGDTLKVVYPRLDRISAMGMFPAEFNFTIAGIYSSGFYESDRSLLICTIADAQNILNILPGFAKLEIRLNKNHIDQAVDIAAALQGKLGAEYSVYPWTLFSAGLLRLVAMEKWLIFIIFCFLVLIAGINVISAVTTIILDKRNEIAVLKTLGSSSRSIKRMLSYQVGLVAIAAIVTGQVFGAFLSFVVEKQSFYKLKGDVYFIDSLSVSISPVNQLVIFAVASVLVSLCIHYPLRQIDRLQIIELLRNQ